MYHNQILRVIICKEQLCNHPYGLEVGEGTIVGWPTGAVRMDMKSDDEEPKREQSNPHAYQRAGVWRTVEEEREGCHVATVEAGAVDADISDAEDYGSASSMA